MALLFAARPSAASARHCARPLPAVGRKATVHVPATAESSRPLGPRGNVTMRLAGKTAVITGGATGIGQAIAVALAARGLPRGDCRPARRQTARSRGRMDRRSADSRAHGRRGRSPQRGRAVPLGRRSSWAKSTSWSTAPASTRPSARMADMPPETWDEVLAINATGAYNCMHAVLPGMRARKDGLIININSISGHRASMLGGVAYSASKFALTALEHGGRAGRRKKRHPRDQHLPGRGRHAAAASPARASEPREPGQNPATRRRGRRRADGRLPAAHEPTCTT